MTVSPAVGVSEACPFFPIGTRVRVNLLDNPNLFICGGLRFIDAWAEGFHGATGVVDACYSQVNPKLAPVAFYQRTMMRVLFDSPVTPENNVKPFDHMTFFYHELVALDDE